MNLILYWKGLSLKLEELNLKTILEIKEFDFKAG